MKGSVLFGNLNKSFAHVFFSLSCSFEGVSGRRKVPLNGVCSEEHSLSAMSKVFLIVLFVVTLPSNGGGVAVHIAYKACESV